MPADAPTNTFAAALTDYPTYYGTKIVFVGEQGEWVIAPGHVEPRRMAAAAQAALRHVSGERHLFGGFYEPAAQTNPLAFALTRIEHTTAAVQQPSCETCPDHGGGDCPGTRPWGISWQPDIPNRDVQITILNWT